MKILFEDGKYETEVLDSVLNNRFYSPLGNLTHSKVEYVGYYYDSEVNDAVIILPKVFVDENNVVFGKYTPQEILEYSPEIKRELRKDGHERILYDISTWIYQAIRCFRSRNENSTITDSELSGNIISNQQENDNTMLDIILSLLRFQKDNQQLFTYIAKVNNSGRKICWNKTIAIKTPFINGSTPIYADVVAKKKSINFDEELIVMFYSVLNYIGSEYGFDVRLNQNYDLIKGANFTKLLACGTRRLRAIKNNYFSDKLVALWKLLYLFFDKASISKRSGKKREELLLVKDFNIVFEDMIDDLIGDKRSDIPKFFKDQSDGKIVDHIYKDKALVFSNPSKIIDDIYFVGDSKYYKSGAKVGKESVEKQYTYAKNIIQYNFDLFYDKTKSVAEGIRYRDTELTEGYNITPNFFISAILDEDYKFNIDGLRAEKGKHSTDIKYQFENRLFDRDTLLVQRYNINFLFVLSAYVSRGSITKHSFKKRARKEFRTRMIEYFNDTYTFHVITPNESIESFVDKYFRILNGKMYRPSDMEHSLIVAYENKRGESLPDQVARECRVAKYKLS